MRRQFLRFFSAVVYMGDAVVVFFSPRDPHSRKFLEQLSRCKHVRPTLRDIHAEGSSVPRDVTHVPTVAVPEGNTTRLLAGSAAFSWLAQQQQLQRGIADYDAGGAMGGASLGFSSISGDGSIASQQQFVYICEFT